MSKEIAGTRDYTASEDINDVRQLITLVKARPAVKKAGDRATLISYAELTMIEKRLAHALGLLAEVQADLSTQKIVQALAFPRPMGAPPVTQDERDELRKEWKSTEDLMRQHGVGKWTKLRGYNVLQLGAADYIEYNGELLSVNGDSSNTYVELASVPFGIRWVVTADNMKRNQYGTKTDAVAVAEFRRVGLLEEGE